MFRPPVKESEKKDSQPKSKPITPQPDQASPKGHHRLEKGKQQDVILGKEITVPDSDGDSEGFSFRR